MPIRVHVALLLKDPIPPETNEQMVERVLTIEGWMDGILTWEHEGGGHVDIEHIAMSAATADPGDDWATRVADASAS